MPVFLTVLIAKSLLNLSRLIGRGGGSALPGLVAEKLDPQIGSKLAKRIPHGSIIVTGTNGKTTTSKMLARVLTDSGEHLVANRAGSNLSRGVVSALIEHISVSGRYNDTMGLFEVDEAAMPAVASMVQPRAIVVLNLFRDQLDRYGELDTTAGLIGRGIAATQAQLYLNADDPLVASLASYATNPDHVSYFGIDDVPTTKLSHDVTADSNTCPECGRALIYSKSFFGHIGHYRCPKGHIKRPQTAVSADKITLNDRSASFTVQVEDEQHQAKIFLPGLYNIYNALAATAVSNGIGISVDSTLESLSHVQAAFGRVEVISVGSKRLYLLLVKNPTGFNQVIHTFLLKNKQQNVLFIINDNFADGRDISWLWDVAFEELTAQHHTIDVSGIRATDMTLRLKYADIPVRATNDKVGQALNQFIDQLPENGTGYIVPTYTAMLDARKKLGRKVKLSGVWE